MKGDERDKQFRIGSIVRFQTGQVGKIIGFESHSWRSGVIVDLNSTRAYAETDDLEPLNILELLVNELYNKP
jgi:hypothetical protein